MNNLKKIKTKKKSRQKVTFMMMESTQICLNVCNNFSVNKLGKSMKKYFNNNK